MPAPGSTEPFPHHAEVVERLGGADLVIEGRMPWSSNATFLCELWPAGSRPDGGLEEVEIEVPADAAPLGKAIYKPHRGERPLWDFPDGLYRREAAAYDLAAALGWEVVPPTIVRDGPFGIGSVQAFVDADFTQHHFTLVEEERHHEQLRRLCAFDIVANSTDRKGGHVLIDADEHLWAIDNGLCLHAEFKLRTVIWEFADEPLPAELADDLARFVEGGVPAALDDVLDPFERDALLARTRALLADGRFPIDHTGHRVPWPLV